MACQLIRVAYPMGSDQSLIRVRRHDASKLEATPNRANADEFLAYGTTAAISCRL